MENKIGTANITPHKVVPSNDMRSFSGATREIPTELEFGFDVTLTPHPEPNQLEKIQTELKKNGDVRISKTGQEVLVFEVKGSTKEEAEKRLRKALKGSGYPPAETTP